jgi:hypothetical protein
MQGQGCPSSSSSTRRNDLFCKKNYLVASSNKLFLQKQADCPQSNYWSCLYFYWLFSSATILLDFQQLDFQRFSDELTSRTVFLYIAPASIFFGAAWRLPQTSMNTNVQV